MPTTCSRPGCANRPVARLSYAYALSQVEVHPIEGVGEPGSYELCQIHLDRLKVPKGWRLIRGDADFLRWPGDEIESLAREIRRVGEVGHHDTVEPAGTEHSLSRRTNLVTLASRAHLRVVADATRYEMGKTR